MAQRVINNTHLTGEIPIEVTSLNQLGAFDFYDTNLCGPQNVSFDMWLFDVESRISGPYGHVNGTGLVCGKGRGRIIGKIIDSANQPLGNIDIYAHRLINGQVHTASVTTTNSSGIYQLTDVGSGGFSFSYFIYAVDPTETFTPTYFTSADVITNATPVVVSVEQTASLIDMTLGSSSLNSFELQVSILGDGDGSVTSNPVGISCNSDCTETYPSNTVVTLTAQAGFGDFTGWGGACSGPAYQCVITMDEAKNVTATFVQPPLFWDLIVELLSPGVLVTSNPAGVNCGASCGIAFDFGTTVTLMANLSSGFEIDSWGGDCSGSELTCVLVMNGSKRVTISTKSTTPTENHVLSVVKNGTGTGIVTSSPAGINCGSDCVEILSDNEPIELSATPAEGSTFTGWSGGCSGLNNCALSLSEDTVITATFSLNPEPVTLTVEKAGTGSGQVVGTAVNIDCGTSCETMINSGTLVTLTATAESNSEFTGWSSGSCSGMGICSFTITENQTITANFIDVVQPTFPVAPLQQPPNNQVVDNAKPTFSWKPAADNGSGVVSYTVTATRTQAVRSIVTSPITYTFTTTNTMVTPQFNLQPGNYEWSVDAHDAAGNVQRAGEVRRFSINFMIYLPMVTRP